MYFTQCIGIFTNLIGEFFAFLFNDFVLTTTVMGIHITFGNIVLYTFITCVIIRIFVGDAIEELSSHKEEKTKKNGVDK